MTYYELIKDAEHKLNFNKITLGEYEEMIEPLKREIEQQPCEYEPFTIAEVSPEMRKLMEEWQQPCEDAVSREALMSLAHTVSDDDSEPYKIVYVADIINLPSVKPTYTDEEIQKMQELEQAQLEKAYELGMQTSFEEWLSSFNTDSATECFTAVQELKEKLNGQMD